MTRSNGVCIEESRRCHRTALFDSALRSRGGGRDYAERKRDLRWLLSTVYVVSGRRLSSHFASSGLRLNDRPSDLHDNGHRLVSNLCESASTRTSTREYGTTTPDSSCCFLPSRNNTVSSQQLLTPWRRLGKFNAKFDRVLRNNKLQKF